MISNYMLILIKMLFLFNTCKNKFVFITWFTITVFLVIFYFSKQLHFFILCLLHTLVLFDIICFFWWSITMLLLMNLLVQVLKCYFCSEFIGMTFYLWVLSFTCQYYQFDYSCNLYSHVYWKLILSIACCCY